MWRSPTVCALAFECMTCEVSLLGNGTSNTLVTISSSRPEVQTLTYDKIGLRAPNEKQIVVAYRNGGRGSGDLVCPEGGYVEHVSWAKLRDHRMKQL